MSHRITKGAFKNATMEIYAHNAHGACDTLKLVTCANAIHFLMEHPRESDDQLVMMRYVNTALRSIYPELHPNDRSTLNTYLQRELDILAKIVSGEKIAEHEYLQIMRFCQEMWVQLGYAESEKPPHRAHT